MGMLSIEVPVAGCWQCTVVDMHGDVMTCDRATLGEIRQWMIEVDPEFKCYIADRDWPSVVDAAEKNRGIRVDTGFDHFVIIVAGDRVE